MPSQQLQTVLNIQKQKIPKYGSSTNINSKLLDNNLHNLMFGSLQCVHQLQQHHETLSSNSSHASLSPIHPSTSGNLNGGLIGGSGLLPLTSSGTSTVYGSEQQLCQQYSSQQHSDYIISDYMEKIGTRISMLETELQFSWGALDLLSTEYSKIWSRLEKLENIMVEQQSVVNNLMGLINIKSRKQQQLEINNENELFINDLYLSAEMQPQCHTNSGINESIDIRLKDKSDQFYEELNKQDTRSTRLESKLDTLSELLKEQQFAEENLQYSSLEKSKTTCLMYSMDDGEIDSKRYGSPSSLSLPMTAPLQPLISKTAYGIQHNLLPNLHSAYAEQTERDNNSCLYGLTTNNRVTSISTLPKSYNSLNAEIDNVDTYGCLISETEATQADTLTSDKFFRKTASKTGPDVIQIIQEDTGGEEDLKSKINEDFYKTLNEMYRENTLATELGYSIDPWDQQNEKLLIVLSNNSTRANSALDMITEDNEDESNNEKQSKGFKTVEESILEAVATTKSTSVTSSSPTKSNLSIVPRHAKNTRKHKKKKDHHKDEMEMINNLKSALAQKNMNMDFTNFPAISICKENQTNWGENSSEIRRSSTTNSSFSEENFSHFYDSIEKLDSISKIILLEISKIAGFPPPSREAVNELRKLVMSEKFFLEKLNHVNQNLILLLLNPLTMAEELISVESTKWFKMVMRKLEKNIDTLKKLVGNSLDNYRVEMKLASSLCSLTAPCDTKSTTDDVLLTTRNEKNAPLVDASVPPELNDYSVQLMRHNSNLDEQLKLLDNQEQEIKKKKLSQQDQDELQSCTNYLGLSNYEDIDVSYENILLKQITDRNPKIYPSSSLVENSMTSLSSNNIYSNDAYIRSLKRSLERHNSMLFLLHLQNPDYKDKMKELAGLVDKGDDLIMNQGESHSPPPPAPDIDTVGFNNTDQGNNNVTLFLENKDTGKTLNPFIILDSCKNAGPEPELPYSLKQPNSDSGLSSMIGLSTWGRLPRSPVSGTFNDRKSNPFLTKHHHDINIEMLELLSMTPQKLSSEIELTDFDIEQTKKTKEYVFSEENLNYIRELSRNLPICSAFENKSMFSIFHHNIFSLEGSSHTVDEMLAWDQQHQQQQIEKGRTPDLLKNQMNRPTFLHSSENYQQTNKTYLKSNSQLTDHLVYYPTSQSLLDNNSSRKADRSFVQHSNEKHYDDSGKLITVCQATIAPDPSPIETTGSHHREYSKQQPKVWRRLGNLLHDNFRLKRPTRYNRSHSLPSSDINKQRSKKHTRGHAVSNPSVIASSNKDAKVAPNVAIRQKSVQNLSPTNSIGDNNKKRSSFSTTMNNFMQKAKTYRQYSFGLRHGSSLSDPEADLASFTSSDNEDSIASDYGGNPLKDFDVNEKGNCNGMKPNNFELHYKMQNVEDLEVFNKSHKKNNLKQLEANDDKKATKKFQVLSENNINLNKSSASHISYLENEEVHSEERKNDAMGSMFPIVGDKTSKANRPQFHNMQSPDINKVLTQENNTETIDNQTFKGHSDNQHHLKKENSFCVNDDHQQLYSISPNITIEIMNHITAISSESSLIKNSSTNERSILTSTQQSLEIPSFKEDEDNRSQYSYRTLSSSRRQSTEDSIDTDDEYFCYELRQLDELEKQQKEQQYQQQERHQQRQEEAKQNQQIFNQIDQLAVENNRDDLIDYAPDVRIRAKMSEVLQELKHKVKLQPEISQHRQPVKSRVLNQKYTKVTDMHKAWQDIHGDETFYSHLEPSFEIENCNQQVILEEVDGIDQDKQLQERLQAQEIEKPFLQKRYKKKRNMRRSNVTIDSSVNDLDYPDAQTYSTSSSLSSEDESKRQHSKNLKPTQIRRNSHERQKTSTIILKQQLSYLTESSSSEKEKEIFYEIEQMESKENKDQRQNDFILSSDATSGPDSPNELSDLDNEQETDEIFKTVPNYHKFKINQQNMAKISHNGLITKKDGTPPSEISHTNILNNQKEHKVDHHDCCVDEHAIHKWLTLHVNENMRNSVGSSDTNEFVKKTDITESAQLLSQQQHHSEKLPSKVATPPLQGTDETKSVPKLISQDSSIDISQSNGAALGSSKWKLLKTLKERKLEERNNQDKIKEDELNKQREKNGSGSGDVGLRGNGHPSDNPFYSNIDSMPDIRPRRKSIPLVSELFAK